MKNFYERNRGDICTHSATKIKYNFSTIRFFYRNINNMGYMYTYILYKMLHGQITATVTWRMMRLALIIKIIIMLP